MRRTMSQARGRGFAMVLGTVLASMLGSGVASADYASVSWSATSNEGRTCAMSLRASAGKYYNEPYYTVYSSTDTSCTGNLKRGTPSFINLDRQLRDEAAYSLLGDNSPFISHETRTCSSQYSCDTTGTSSPNTVLAGQKKRVWVKHQVKLPISTGESWGTSKGASLPSNCSSTGTGDSLLNCTAAVYVTT